MPGGALHGEVGAVDDRDVAAYRYAWWLTGDTVRARAIMVRAADTTPGPLPALLAAVRREAGSPLCPASELALLHDVHDLDVDAAAALVGVDHEDVLTELAHGRLEALSTTVSEPFAHPDRLGGLAVGNPPDVAHARQCASCGTARRLLLQGRAALREMRATPVWPEASAGLEQRPVAPTRRRVLELAAAVVLGVLSGVGLLVGTTPQSPPRHAEEDAATAPPASRSETAPATLPRRMTAMGAAARVALPGPARLLGSAGEPRRELASGEALRLAVDHTRPAPVVEAHWISAPPAVASAGDPLPLLLSPPNAVGWLTWVFGAPAPRAGWPVGEYGVAVTVDGALVSSVAITVAE